MGEKIIDPFNQLLNKINRELTRENLQSLVHICGKHVSAGEKEKIECGLDLFKYLQQRGIISHDKVGNLWKFMAKMLPPRADIVRLVNDYIKKEYHTNDVRSVLQDLSESYEQFNNPAFSSSAPAPQDTNREMKIDTECMYCVCRKPPSRYACLGFIGISVFIFIVVAIVVWYTEAPKDPHPYIIGAAIVLFLFVIGCCLWPKCKSCHRRGYTNIINSTLQLAESGERTVISETVRVVSAQPRAHNNEFGCASSADSVGISVRVGGTSFSSAEVVE